jgi:hypothetical protein
MPGRKKGETSWEKIKEGSGSTIRHMTMTARGARSKPAGLKLVPESAKSDELVDKGAYE